MFGLSTFAEVPFASLAGPSPISVSVSEPITLSDSYVTVVTFTSVLTETVTLTDTIVVSGTYSVDLSAS